MTKNELHRTCARLLTHLAPRDPLGRRPYDLIIGFGVCDLTVPATCADLWHRRAAPTLLFAGGVGAGSGDLIEPEAVVFRDHATKLGVKAAAILIEPDSTNTYDNVVRSRALLADRGFHLGSAVLVAQPHRQRRVWLTCQKQLPGVTLCNRPPDTPFDEAAALFGGPRAYAPKLLGELQRITRYSGWGDIAQDSLPSELEPVVEALSGLDLLP